ncbi:MAG: ribonuclease HII [Candidatus Paceibacterota bacterium]|jgi:ribonuclease HII
MLFPDFKNELKYIREGCTFVVGCDEVGRGPSAGPVVAAACILNPLSVSKTRSGDKWYARVRDSKTIPEAEREILSAKILDNSLAYGVGIVWQDEIDKLNIHNASLKAMQMAVLNLVKKIKKVKRGSTIRVLVDGRFTIPNLKIGGIKLEQMSIVAGDSHCLSVSAASIIAKVKRDAIMRELDLKFPEYGFKRHKGYNTPEHKRAIKKFGASVVHRKSFVK